MGVVLNPPHAGQRQYELRTWKASVLLEQHRLRVVAEEVAQALANATQQILIIHVQEYESDDGWIEVEWVRVAPVSTQGA